MATVSIEADIKARWHQGQSAYSPGTVEELSIIAIDLLIRELGTESAHAFIAQVLSRHTTPGIEA